MDKSLLAHLTAAETHLWNQTEPKALAELGEDEVLDLHARIRRARNKYTGQYRRGASTKVAAAGARGVAKPASTAARARAEVFEEALSRVSRRLAALSRQASADLKAERLAAARGGDGGGPVAAPAKSAAKPTKSVAREHAKTTGGVKKDASSRAMGARRQAKRDAR